MNMHDTRDNEADLLKDSRMFTQAKDLLQLSSHMKIKSLFTYFSQDWIRIKLGEYLHNLCEHPQILFCEHPQSVNWHGAYPYTMLLRTFQG